MTADPIADMLTRVRNALIARHPKVDVPASRLKSEIARILKDEGYILNYKLTEEGAKKYIRLYLTYTPGNLPVISRIERVSRPGCRVYVGSNEIPLPAERGAILDSAGKPLGERERAPTPNPATPEAMLRVMDEIAKRLGKFDRVSVGFPVVVKRGATLTAHNIDPTWIGYDLQTVLARQLFCAFWRA